MLQLLLHRRVAEMQLRELLQIQVFPPLEIRIIAYKVRVPSQMLIIADTIYATASFARLQTRLSPTVL